MKKLFFGALSTLCLLGAGVAEAKLKVVTSVQTLASVAKEVGGDKIEIASLSKGSTDPHFVDAKPSLASLLGKADVLIYAGLDLEVGWLPTLVTASRNPAIATGGAGEIDASKFVKVLDVLSTADRSLGDIHPQGNPHYFTAPAQVLRVAKGMSERFAKLDPTNAKSYEAGYAAFEKKITAKMADWEKRLSAYKGTKVVTFHRSWSYMLDWLALSPIGYVEPKPGITPDPSYLATLVATMKSEGVKVVISESYYNPKVASLVASKAGATLLSLPANVGGSTASKDYESMMEDIVTQLETALKK